MRKAIVLKTLVRSPVKSLLTFLLLTAASFALFSRVTDYVVTTRESKNAEGLYHAVASLDNEVPDIYIETNYVDSPDGTVSAAYGFVYKMEDKPWLTEQQRDEFASLPGVTVADTRYMTAGRVENYNRLVGEGNFGGTVVFEGTYRGYENGKSVLEDHICLKFDDVKVIACDGGPEIRTSFTTEDVPLGDMQYAKSPYTRAFYDSLAVGSRCLVVADNTGHQVDGSSGIYFRPQAVGEGALCVINGLPDNYLETKAFARQKGWVDAINHNLTAYDIVYTSDMRAIPKFNEQRQIISKGRFLVAEDTSACVVSEDFLETHRLSIGDSINIQLGNKFCHGNARAEEETEDWYNILDDKKIPEYVDSREFVIVGAYSGGRGDSVYVPSPNTIYVPSSVLPMKVPKGYEPSSGEFSVFIEDAHHIKAFHEAAEQFAEKVDLTLEYSDRGWLDVKESLEMGALASFLTTILYVAGAALALFFAVYLHIGRNKKSYAIMRMIGVPGRAAGNAVVLPFVTLSVLAVPIGGIVGLYYAQETAEKTLFSMADSTPAGYVPNAALPLSVVILCLVSELLFITLIAYLFLQKMKKTPPLELLQEGVKPGRKDEITPNSIGSETVMTVPAKLDMVKISDAEGWIPKSNYGATRHVAAYVWRNIRRGVGKSAVSLILTVVLAAGVGTFVLARITYQDAFYGLGVKGRASDFLFSSVTELSTSSLIKDFYCYDRFGVRVQGMEMDIPMTITSDLVRSLGDKCTVDYVVGYDSSAFEGTAQVCLIGKDLLEELGISPGDELGILSDSLYAALQQKGEEGVSTKGYKAYRVIGVVDSDDAGIRGGIFTGIRSDLQRLFSMDFPVEYSEFTLANNERLDELEIFLKEKMDRSSIYTPSASYHLDSGGLTDIERIRGLLESLFPIAVAAAVLIGLFGPLLVILQSAQEAAFLRILGVTKKRARCMLAIEQIVLCIAGIILVAGGVALYDPGRFARGIETFAGCFGLYLLGCVCGAVAASIQVTRHRLLELLQVKE